MLKKIFLFAVILSIFFLNPLLLKAAGSISGRVTDTGTNGIANISVNLYQLDGTYLTTVYTDGNGDYTIPDIAAGSYKVKFYPWDAGNYLEEWYNDKADIDSADAVNVIDGQTTNLSDAVLADGGMISGRVTDGAVGIDNVVAEVYDVNHMYIKNAWTDSSGNYTVEGLPGGNYKVYFDTSSAGNYISEWYNDQSDFSSADQVSVTTGQTSNLSDAVLVQGGIISGTVKDSLGSGINNVAVRVYDLSNNYLTSYYTNSSGVYSLEGIPAGDWKIYFDTSNAGNYIEEWYNDKSDFNSADQVTVSVGQTTNLTDAVLTEGGMISGRVTDTQGTGLETVSLFVYDLSYNFVTNGYTDNSGYYTLEALPAGTYKLQVEPPDGMYNEEWYNDKSDFNNADQISVSLGQTANLDDAVLNQVGAISGRVTDSTGTVGIAGVDVQVCDLAQNWLYGATTDSNGDYTVNDVVVGSYRVEFRTDNVSGNYAREWYNDKGTFNDADVVTVTFATTSGGIDAQLSDGGSISGRVTDSLGSGVANVDVNIHDTDRNIIVWPSTDSNGDYSVKGIPAGDYKVQFRPWNAGNYIEEWYNDQADFDSAGAVTVTAGQTTTGIDAQLADSGAVSGRVTDSTGTTGIAQVDVQVYNLAEQWLNGTSTDSNGDYTIHGIPAGNYKIEFRTNWTPGNYVGEWYNDKNNFQNADTVSVTIGQTTTGIDAQLADGGAVSGRVTDSSGNGIANVDVQICDLNQYWLNGVSTDANGDYTIYGLAAGDYKIQFGNNWTAGNYVDEWYNDKSTFENADAVSVNVGQTTSGIDAQLADGGAISGRVTDGSGTVGIANVPVQTYDSNQNWLNGVSTDSEGYYTITGMQAGNYKVEFRTYNVPGNYFPEWYNDKSSFDSADTVSVSVGQTTAGIDAHLASGAGGISGRVTDSLGAGIGNVDVQICDMNQSWLPGASTDSSGYYTIYGLAPGSYKIQFRTDNIPGNYVFEWYDDQVSFESGDVISVTAGSTTAGIDAQLADGGSIGGRVTDSGGSGIANVDVNIHDLNGNYIAWTSTDSNGDYTVKGIPAGDHRVQFGTWNTGNYIEEWYNDKGAFDNADNVTVTAGNTTTGIDAQLTTGGIISGKVMDSSLIGIENIQVTLYDMNDNWITNCLTDSNGDYMIQRLSTDNYKVYFETAGAGNYIREWYNDKSDSNNADAVAVIAGSTTGNINAVLADGGGIGGRVTGSLGGGIAGISVQVCDLNYYWYDGTSTDSNGDYTLTGLPSGDYKVEFRTDWTPGNYVGEWYNDKSSFESADAISVTTGQTAVGIDAQLADGGSIGGRVTDSQGNGIGNVNVNVCDLNQYWLYGVGTDNDGYYTIYGIPAGSFKIQFDGRNQGSYALEWWNNKRNFDDADNLSVTAGNTITGIDAQLETAGSITGTVTDDSTAGGIGNVRVVVYDLDNNEMGESWTDGSGYYTVSNLYPGNFKVYFNTGNVPLYIAEWYNDKDTFENADQAVVNEGAATIVNVGLAAIQDDGYDPNDDYDHAAEILAGIYNNLVYLSPDGEGAEQDWYKVYIGSAYAGKDLKVNVKVTSPYPPDPPDWWRSDIDFDILDGTGRLLAKALSSSDDETLYIANLTEGWYYINVNYCTVEYRPDYTGVHADYSLTVEIGDNFGIGYISGRVTDEQGQGIGNSLIRMMHSPWDASISYPTISTDLDGYYTIGYTAGDYTLYFNLVNPSFDPPAPNYVGEYYNDKTSYNDASVLSIHTGASITGIDAVLMAGGTIEGTLTHADGNPIIEDRHAYALVYNEDNNQSWVMYCYNDGSGNYSVKYLRPGNYRVAFRGWDENWNRYAREWYNDKPSFGTADNVTISTAGDVVTGINAQFSAPGSIQGRVTDESGQGIGNVKVCVYSSLDPDNIMVYAYTNGNGDYIAREIFAGDVKIYFDADEQHTAGISEWYNDKGDFAGADSITITAGQTVSAIDAVLAEKGKISGRVTDGAGNGIADVDISVYDLNNNGIGWAGTDADGYYTVEGVPGGDCKVEFRTDNVQGSYTPEWYNNKYSFDNADIVSVTDGQTTAGIDAQLAETGGISGKVMDASLTGTGSVQVMVYDMNNNHIADAVTDGGGNYTIQELPAGDYKVYFNTGSTIYLSEWFNDKGDFNSADTVTVNAGNITGDINAVLTGAGAVSGRITDTTGTVGISGVEIEIYDLNNYGYPGTTTDNDGNYTIGGLPAGTYKVRFVTRYTPGNYVGEWYNDQDSFNNADTIQVNVGQVTTGIDAQLADGGSISGRATDTTGTIGVSAGVGVYDLNNNSLSSVGTDDDGYYAINGIPPGTYKVYFDTNGRPGNYVSGWHLDKDSFDNADTVQVTVGITAADIDGRLEEGGYISGRVTDAQAAGIENVNINVYDLNNDFIKSTTTDSNGDYTVNRVPAGSYRVYFDGNQAGNYLSQWYNDKASFDEADGVVVTSGQTTANIDAQLAEGGIISGRVTNESAQGIAGVQVQIRDLENNWIGAADTDSNGDYSVQRLTADSYKVYFNIDNANGLYVAEYYNDKDNFGDADAVNVTAGATSTVDAVLADGGAVSGRVTNDAGDGIQGVRVEVRDSGYRLIRTANTDENGDYTTIGLAVGSYKVYFNAYRTSGNYMPEWYNDKDSFDNGDTISVNAGQTTAGIDAVLAPGCIISGTVTDGSANPIAWMQVYVCDTAGRFITNVFTGSSGNYELNGLTPGDYKVLFYPWYLNHYGVEYFGFPRDYNYKIQWYNNKLDFPSADVVSTAFGTPAAGIDAVITEDSGVISGQITDGQGGGIQDCYVLAFQSKDDMIDAWDSGYSGADGSYEIKGLPTGNYMLLVVPPWDTSYRRILYDNTLDIEQAAYVSVTQGQTTGGIDMVLSVGGTVTGRVTDGNGNGLQDVLVRLIDPAANKYLGWIGNGATTDVDGYYTVNAQPGQWKVIFQAHDIPGGGFVSEFYHDRSTVESADVITVSPDQEVAGIDAVLAAGGGKISGYVRDTNGTALENVTVSVYDTQYQNFIAYSYTDTSGYFEVPGLIPGNYTAYVKYFNLYPSEWYNDKSTFETADHILVTDGGDTQINVILGDVNPDSTAVTGQVTNSSGTGIENVDVNFYDMNNNLVAATSTDSNGNYALQYHHIPLGDYRVYFDGGPAGNYLSEWYENREVFDEADTITVTAGQTLENLDARLADGGVLSGQVFNESAAGIEGVLVRVRDLEGQWVGAVATDAGGNYSVQRLTPGSYKVYFDITGAVGFYVGEWYDDKDSFDTADIVVITPGGTTTVNPVLAAGGAISGTVTDGSANPIEGMQVDIYDTDGNYIDNGYTDSSGNYQVRGLAVGSYRVNFNPWDLNYHADWYGFPQNFNYKAEWYNDKEFYNNADEVTVTAGSSSSGIDAVMTDGDGGIISGQITDSTGSGIQGAFVYAFPATDAFDWYYSDYFGTGPDGNYQIKGLPAGNYILLFIPPGGTFYRRQLYDNTLDVDNVAPVAVAAGQTTAGIDAVLPEGGTVNGRVTGSNGNGLENVLIRLMDAATNKYLGWVGNNGWTDADGYYTVNAQPGQWKVMFQAFDVSGGGYVSEFYNDRSVVENGEIITVSPGEPLNGIDAVLSTGGGMISGYVKAPGNSGLCNAEINVYNSQYKTLAAHVSTDTNGYFEIHGLIPGNYKIITTYYQIYPSEWYSDQTSYETANELTVAQGGNTGVVIVLGGPDPEPLSVTVTSPNGGESLNAGSIHEITWSCPGMDETGSVIIDYSTNNGASWITAAAGTANTGQYNWTVPQTASDNCLVRITAGDSDEGTSDISDAVFSIVSTQSLSIKLKSPNRWITLTADSMQEITWFWTGDVETIGLEYSINSGTNWIPIVSSTANTGSYLWQVPDTPSDNCLIRIRVGDEDGGLTDISQYEFTIVSPSYSTITVVSPNGGETWNVGSRQTITWTGPGTVENVKIEYSTNSGSTWTEITPTAPNTGSYTWILPDTPSENCLVRVSDVEDDPADVSDAEFSIALPRAITVTSPNGGETWETGTSQDIAWTTNGNFGDLDIHYSTDNGHTWTIIESSTVNDGLFSWTVPDDPSENCLIRISETGAGDDMADLSDAEFSIVPAPGITVVSPNGGEKWKAGSTYNITWTSSGITGDVVIDLYRGEAFDFNIGTKPVDEGELAWNIPGTFTAADDYKVLIHQGTAEDYSDAVFSITDQDPNTPDFNNDGKVDILWRNYAAGNNEVWFMDGVTHTGTGALQAMADLNWRIVGTGDFNRDGKVDILWRNYTDGQNLLWIMDGTALTGTVNLPVQLDANWEIAGTGDFNSDGKVDILWRSPVEGRNLVWYMDGTAVAGYGAVQALKDPSWRIAGTGDFNSDGKPDILWRNYETGANQVWYMNGVVYTGTAALPEQVDLNLQIAGAGNFNNDGKIDILWRNYSDGQNMVWYMDGVVQVGTANIETRADLNWRIAGNGDYK